MTVFLYENMEILFMMSLQHTIISIQTKYGNTYKVELFL